MPTPVFALNPNLAPDAVVAVAMVALEVYILIHLVPRDGKGPTLTRMIIGSTALFGSGSLLMALLAAFVNPNYSTYTDILYAINFMMMGPIGLWLISLVVFRDRLADTRGWLWPVAVGCLATAAEVLMGLLFTVGNVGLVDPVTILAGTLSSVWFFWSMGAAMVALLVWIPFRREVRQPLAGLALTAFAAPWVTADPVAGAALVSVVMAGTLIVVLSPLLFAAPARPPPLPIVTGVIGAFVVMGLVELLAILESASVPSTLAWGVAMAVVMTTEFVFVVHEGYELLGARSALGRARPGSGLERSPAGAGRVSAPVSPAVGASPIASRPGGLTPEATSRTANPPAYSETL